MGYSTQLDQSEIDQEMGWANEIKKDRPAKRGTTILALAIIALSQGPPSSSPSPMPFPSPCRLLSTKPLFFPLISPLSYSKSFNVEGDMMVVKRSWKWRIVDAAPHSPPRRPRYRRHLFDRHRLRQHPSRARPRLRHPRIFRHLLQKRPPRHRRRPGTHRLVRPARHRQRNVLQPRSLPHPKMARRRGVPRPRRVAGSIFAVVAGVARGVGFAVLLVDMRGQGESEAATAVTYGLRDRLRCPRRRQISR